MITKAGIQYRDHISGTYKRFRKANKHLNLPEDFPPARIYERCMRMGREVILYHLDESEVWDVAHASLKEDVLLALAGTSSPRLGAD